ncbi:hypothetical protein [Defluviimonas salinarum]|uniref:DUF1508 domain-containing protein n=1 Tax=Defluviimonas salinarum TaxID=2992147 RepID=A0ABT3J856_9RHOB|nr:hypothetical protein [Defluviimonas salinarum]MCW3783564.1 hypothetical protein [Defluviimonas salinarum]
MSSNTSPVAFRTVRFAERDGDTLYLFRIGSGRVVVGIEPDYAPGLAAELLPDEVRRLLEAVRDRTSLRLDAHGLKFASANRGEPYRDGFEFSFVQAPLEVFVEDIHIDFVQEFLEACIPAEPGSPGL